MRNLTASGILNAVMIALALALLFSGDPPPPPGPGAKSAFDGKTLDGWEGDAKTWRVQEGCITGGSLEKNVPRNEFLTTTRRYGNFIIRLKFKLQGAGGFINGGVQFRSERIPNNAEMIGYQADIGDPDWWGCIYDESRRNRVLAKSDIKTLGPHIRRNDWNDYVVRADGTRLTTWINGEQAIDWNEPDDAIPDSGLIGLQVHGGGKALIQFKEITIEELPPGSARFAGAPPPPKPPGESPLPPEGEKACFSLPPGFEIDLVAAEQEGIGKFIAVTWDLRGRMWTMTALEYPVDANDNAARAEALYAKPGRDKILIYDGDPKAPRVFADGLAIPLGLLPYKNGAYVQFGHDILFVEDTDGDGRADTRRALLTGFGIHDSHLLPHQFTRQPGGRWIYFAQGAFNRGVVKTTDGATRTFNGTHLARFTPDGARFETLTWGPNNIWGFVIDAEGEIFMQEANDFGYSVVPYLPGGHYPSLGGIPKPYTPETPGLASFRMGGTGLSGLALSDRRGGYPGPYADAMFVANPITRAVQAVRILREGPRYELRKLPDFLLSSDPMFRPIAMAFGPDGCLYVVDWYNKVISHNEVPRNHPDRDKSRGRIWRVRHKDQAPHKMADFLALPEGKLIDQLAHDGTTLGHLAWQAIVDRNAAGLAPRLKEIAADPQAAAPTRLRALWALEGLGLAEPALLLKDPNRNIRREAVRILGEGSGDLPASDPDPQVRVALIRALASRGDVPRLVRLGREPLDKPTAPTERDKKVVIKVREAFEREFERYHVRAALEGRPDEVEAFLATPEAANLPAESLLLAALALPPERSAARVAALLGKLKRPPNREELLRLAQFPDAPGSGDALKALLRNPAALQGLLEVRNRLDSKKIQPLLEEAARGLLAGEVELGLQVIGAFKLTKLLPEVTALLDSPDDARKAAALRSLRLLGGADSAKLLALFRSSPGVRDEALAALAADPQALTLWPELTAAQRRIVMDGLSSTLAGAKALMAAIRAGSVARVDLDGATLDRLAAVLGNDAELEAHFRPVLRLDGSEEGWTETGIDLPGPFTVETWIKLDPGITNADGILGVAGKLDINFFDSRFRVWAGAEVHDAAIAKRKVGPDLWTHVAASRDARGSWKLYVDGELDTAESKLAAHPIEKPRLGWTASAGGTAALLAEYRIWSRERTADEIRAHFDRSFEGQPRPDGLIFHAPGGGPWGKLHGTAKLGRTNDAPPLVTADEARELDAKFEKFRALVGKPGDAAKGKAFATATCLKCHLAKGEGKALGPDLSGAGMMGVEALLRAILTPNAGIESGYATWRAYLKSGDVVDGFFVSEDAKAVVLRRPDLPDTAVPKSDMRKGGFVRRSLMPEGLLEALPPAQVADLFAFLMSLK